MRNCVLLAAAFAVVAPALAYPVLRHDYGHSRRYDTDVQHTIRATADAYPEGHYYNSREDIDTIVELLRRVDKASSALGWNDLDSRSENSAWGAGSDFGASNPHTRRLSLTKKPAIQVTPGDAKSLNLIDDDDSTSTTSTSDTSDTSDVFSTAGTIGHSTATTSKKTSRISNWIKGVQAAKAS